MKDFQNMNCQGCYFADPKTVGSGEPCCTYQGKIELIMGRCQQRQPGYNAKGRYKDYDRIIAELTHDLGGFHREDPDPPWIPGGSHANKTLDEEVQWLRSENRAYKTRQISLLKKIIALVELLKTKDAV